MNILDTIVAAKKTEVAQNKDLVSIKKLEQHLYFDTTPLSLEKHIRRIDQSGIIAEFKKKSPSKPNINLEADVEHISIGYMKSGASALSILTDQSFFGGHNEDLQAARKINFCPILRKDFVIDEYQIIEAKSIGADAILLIASILTKAEIDQYSAFAASLGLEVLLEIHHEQELEKISSHTKIIGINNRNLDTFETDYKHSLNMLPLLPKELCKISESGLKSTDTLVELKMAGYNGFLIGERFMMNADPVKACQQFIQDYERSLILETSIVSS